jgi:hypothetical protein
MMVKLMKRNKTRDPFTPGAVKRFQGAVAEGCDVTDWLYVCLGGWKRGCARAKWQRWKKWKCAKKVDDGWQVAANRFIYVCLGGYACGLCGWVDVWMYGCNGGGW